MARKHDLSEEARRGFMEELNGSYPPGYPAHRSTSNSSICFTSTGGRGNPLSSSPWNYTTASHLMFTPDPTGRFSSGYNTQASSARSHGTSLIFPPDVNHEACSPGTVNFSPPENPADRARPETSMTEASEWTQKVRWCGSDVLLLLTLYSERKERFKDINVKNKTLWEEISTEFNKKGLACTTKMCETKMKNLKRSYISCIDHNKKTGNDPKKCVYFDEMHEIFSRDDTVEPIAVCSNINGKVVRKKSSMQSDNESNSQSNTSDNEDPPIPQPPKKGKRKGSDDIVGLFKEFAQDRKEEEKERMKKLADMHSERMDLMNRFLNVFEKSLKKE